LQDRHDGPVAGTELPPVAWVEEELDITFHQYVASMVSVCAVVTINAPLHPETEDLFNGR
jgi:lactate dehydrogenase-like 2-hydroxyacid dehydrogenase